MKGFFKKKEKKMIGSGIRFCVIFLCICIFVCALTMPEMFHRGTSLSVFPMGNVTLTLINDISAEEPPRPFNATFGDVTVHPHPCPPPSMGRDGGNKRSPPLVGGDRGGGKLSLVNKGRQTQDVDNALDKEIPMEMEAIWFAYGEETQYLH